MNYVLDATSEYMPVNLPEDGICVVQSVDFLLILMVKMPITKQGNLPGNFGIAACRRRRRK